jgi:site-specific recombinase XerD
MLRHSFSTNTVAAGATLDILKELLGHAWITSTEVYLHVSADRLRDAVDNVPNPIVAHQDERRMR